MATTKLKLGIAATLAASAVAIATREHLAKRDAQSELARLQAEITTVRAADSPAPEPAANTSDPAELARLRAEHMELMRLRGEVSALRTAKEEAEKLLAKTQGQENRKAEEPPDPEKEAYQAVALARMNYARGWAMAFMMFADENGGKMPKSFDEAANHYPAEWASVMSAFDPGKFEIVFNGSLKEVSRPERTIIVREKSPFSNPKQPGFARTYLFADGHTEIHSSPDGNFEDWERERLISPPRTSAIQ